MGPRLPSRLSATRRAPARARRAADHGAHRHRDVQRARRHPALPGDARLRALIRFARRLRRPGIIYCTTTREVDNVYTAMQMLRIPAHRYHGKMASGERNHQQEMYMKAG